MDKIKYIVSIVLGVISLILIGTIISINILPFKYITLLVMGMFLLNGINFLLLHLSKKWSYIISGILSIIICIISVIGIKFGKDTLIFLDNAFNNHKVEVTIYDVIVLKSSNIKSLNDIKDMGYLNSDDYELSAYTGVKVGYDDIYELYNSLVYETIGAILIDDAFIDVLKEDYEDILDNISIIETYKVEKKIESREIDTDKKSFNIFISGSDSRSSRIYNKTRSDVNMILSVNLNTHEVLITSIPRDYYVSVYGKTGLKDKLTHSGIYGMDVSKKTLEDLFDIEIDYSIKVGFNAVVGLVDLVGGIDVYSDTTFNSSHMKGWVVYKGMNYMDGAKALAYSRERYAYASGDRHRILNQQQVLEATIKKICSDKKLLLKYNELLKEFSNFYITDIPSEVITSLVKNQIDTMASWKFNTISVDGKGAMLPTYTAPNSKRYVMIPNEEDVLSASLKIKRVINE